MNFRSGEIDGRNDSAGGRDPAREILGHSVHQQPSFHQIIRHRFFILLFRHYISLKNHEKDAPWFMRDKYGWPIELSDGRPIKSMIRVICQNIRKLVRCL